MKKIFLTLIVAIMGTTGVSAQTDTRLFNHLSVGLNVGTPGIGADIAMPATRWLEVEAGVHIMPKIKYNTNLHLNLPTSTINPYLPQPIDFNDVPIQGKLNMLNGKVLVNFFPIPSLSNFHITVGAYFGKSEVVEVYNTIDGQLLPVNQANTLIKDNGWDIDEIGLQLGNYLLTPDANGNASAKLRTKSFKPYVGLGFGRAVPKHKRVSFKFDLGAMFWGTPQVIDHNGQDLIKQDWDGKDGGAFRIISKLKVYPVLNFRICGRIF
ncbi:MAG: hypothetical protein J6W52_10440 [Bacteroidaceae bacterium]|nr:hypothetical protein [Bacteroidaceae bacterium]